MSNNSMKLLKNSLEFDLSLSDKTSMKTINHHKPYLLAAVGACLYQAIAVLGFSLVGKSIFQRFFILLGGDIANGGIIQGLIVFSTLWAFLEIKANRDLIKKEFGGLCLNILPTTDKHVLLPMDIPNIEAKLTQLKGERGQLIVKKLLLAAIGKFKSTSSMGETIEIISLQSEIQRDLHESGQSNIRYLLWLIPSIGFMGTVIGISQSLAIAHTGKMDDITATLGVAFDTTLVSLVLGAIVTGFFHRLQEETDRLHAHLKEYVISHFVNRLELRRVPKKMPSQEANPSRPSKKAV